jgi:hypothetical protein
VNAAFLLVSVACFTGQTGGGAGKPELVKPPAASPAPVASTASGSCDGCGEREHKLRDRFAARRSDCGCETAPKACCHKTWTAPACDACERESIFSKLKARLGSHGCCDSGCGTSGCAPSAPAPAKAEPVNPPKKIPTGPPAKAGIQGQPLPGIGASTTPTIEVAPVPAGPAVPAPPTITTEPRSPF